MSNQRKEDLETRLRDELVAAHAMLQTASWERDIILGSGKANTPQPDEIAKSEAAYKAALERYTDALHRFSDWVLRGDTTSLPLSKPSVTSRLTQREQEVLALIAYGKSTKEVAHLLRISYKTVSSHRCHISAKIRAHNTADLTRYALQSGIIRLQL